MATALRLIVLLLAGATLHAVAQHQVPLLQPPLRETTLEGYRDHIVTLRGLVQACRNDVKACDPNAVGEDDKVEARGDTFQVRWQWLRQLTEDARNPTLKDRASLLDQASARLDQEFAAAGNVVEPSVAFDPARRATDSILGRPEFRIVSNESWIDRKTNELFAWLSRFFTATSEFSRRSPWLTTVFEWSFVGLSVLAVLIWATRAMDRQRVAISFGDRMPAANWNKESAQWADLARREAEAQNWRDAIHCLFWASIVVLESRRLWRRDYTRTPREYVALLERNSPQQASLRKLTSLFERIWYGLRHAGEEDYAQALALFEDLRHA
jgi:hypothetical protein